MLLVGAVVAAVFGILLGAPTLRLRGDYLAIVTLGFGEIVPIVILNSSKYTDGPNGIGGINPPALGDFTFPTTGNPWPFYITMVVLITISMILIYRLQDSRLGRAWKAIREDELAAAANGINTVVTKLLAFALGASTAGLAGVFASSKLTLVSPNLFRFDVSFTVLAMVVLGGMGNIWGVAAGAFIVFMIQNVMLKQLNILFDNIQVPFLSRHQLHRLPVPAVRDRAGRDDAAAARGPVPEPPSKARAPHRGGRRVRRDGRSDGSDPRMSAEPVPETATEATPAARRRRTRPGRPAPSVLLHADHVSRRFGGLIAVRDVDLVIPENGIISIIGPNGAGKTTFFNVIAGIIDPTAGSVTFRDRVLITRPRRTWLESILWVLPSALALLAGFAARAHRTARPASGSPASSRSASSCSCSWWPSRGRCGTRTCCSASASFAARGPTTSSRPGSAARSRTSACSRA